jgi:DNA-binding NarL/FixJ family response regulator
MHNQIRVVLADDHAVVRKGICEYLEEDSSIHVVTEADNGEEGVMLVARERPDVAVFDIQMPRLNGLDAARRIKAESPETRVLMLTALDDEQFIFAAFQAGANGYLLKTATPDELCRAVRAIAAGQSALSPSVAKKLVERAAGQPTVSDSIETLSDRELDILRFAAKGLGNKQIGSALSISDRTVQGHLANIYSKLHVATGEFLIGVALLLGAFTGIAAFFGGFMNWNFMMAGTTSVNPVFFTLCVLLILAWKTAGYWGLDRYLMPLLGTPWKPAIVISTRVPATGASMAE